MKTCLSTDNTVFAILSFEGPDVYAQAGGLGVRVSHLSRTLAAQGFQTHLFFIGDPSLKGEETLLGRRLTLHRWCQWISDYNLAGCYQGEEAKLEDYTKSIPLYLLDKIVRPAVAQGKQVVILAEEWHTAAAVIRLAKLLRDNHLRDKAIIFWNANNTFGFERIDFSSLAAACTITTVSRYMKHIMWRLGLNPIVIPNGIPRTWLTRVEASFSDGIRQGLGGDIILAKIARWDPDKRWNMAIEAVARLKAKGYRTLLIARGGMEGYGQEMLDYARSLGLVVREVWSRDDTVEAYYKALTDSSDRADILNVKFHCPQEFLKTIYHAAHAVLANSGREPFGLVGLEAMAAGGVAFTGSTGEDYAISFHNSIVLETADAKEIESYLLYLKGHPEEDERIRKTARATAACFSWEQIVESLIQRLEYQGKLQGAIEVGYKATPPKKAAETAKGTTGWLPLKRSVGNRS